jgi:NAD(P)-dependent dehydrogenase (short-subunit alcohol dehydrogenase family)
MFTAYGQSKLANILFTKKLSSLYQDRGLTANCLHPGFVSTSIGTQNQNRPFLARLIKWVSPFIGKTSDKGAETSIYLCSSEEVSSTSGEYFIDCKKAPITKAAESKEDAEKLWQISLELTGLN